MDMEEKYNEILRIYKEKTGKDCYVVDLIDEEPGILDDKIGGVPYIPFAAQYPTDDKGNPLALLLQVNLKNIDLEGYPKEGILEIYTDKDVDYPCKFAVEYFNEGVEPVTDLPKVDLSNYIVKKGYKIKLTKDRCYMPVADYRFEETICNIINDVCGTEILDYDEVELLFTEFDFNDRFFNDIRFEKTTIGGYADFTQTDPRPTHCYSMDECLFKIDTYADYDRYSIGDSGMLFVLINKRDLENKFFWNSIVDWDCY